MAQPKELNRETVPCLVCERRYRFLQSGHLSSPNCTPGPPNDIESYRRWVAETYDVDPEDPLFEREQLQEPQYYQQHAERLGLPR